MSDVTDNLVDNEDLLEILGATDVEDTPIDTGSDDSDEEEASKKLADLRQIAEKLDEVSISNAGSGDIDQDISDWFSGKSAMPSDELNNYIGNSTSKMDYGLTRQTLSNIELMGQLRGFLDSSMEMLFSESAIMGLAPEDLENRVKMGFTMYKELAALNQRTIMSIKDHKLKSGSDSDELDKVSMLLASIPNDKLKTLLQELNSK